MKPDIREMPLDEIRVVKAYRDLVPRPSARDLELLRVDIEASGLDPSRPLVVNEDLVLLDGHTRLEIAKDLGFKWAWVTIKELEDNWAEREFVIKANLVRRQLNTAQRAELGLKLLEIERERAKRRQQLAGQMYGRGKDSAKQEEVLQKWVASLQEQADGEVEAAPEKLGTNWYQANIRSQEEAEKEQGRALELAAKQAGVGQGTLQRAAAIQQAAAQDPEIASQWEEAKAGKATVHQVYRKVRIKDLPQTYGHEIEGPFSMKKPDQPLPSQEENPITEEEKLEWLFYVADKRGVCKESLQWVMDNDPSAWFYWDQILQGRLIAQIGWGFIMDRVEAYELAQIAKLASERPIPAEAEQLGPWALDHVHAGTTADLIETFPAETVHLILTDGRRSGPEEIAELAAFAQRALVPGKWLCAYIPPGLLPVVLQTMAAHGLEYRWTCAVARPNQRDCPAKFTDLAVLNKWWMMLIFQKPSPEARQFAKLPDSDDGELWPMMPRREDGSRRDALISTQVYVKDLPREIITCLTAPGQLVVDPLVRDGGVMGMVAIDQRRRYLLFHPDREEAMAVEFRLEQEKQWRRRQTKQ